jgi:enoyl-[acyl-carrier-protein] reductase (NADH)
VSALEEWVKNKGIFPVQNAAEAKSIAWAVAKKIAREGTSSEYHLKIYEQVITPERIQEIIDRVSQLNIQQFVEQVTTELEILAKNV